MGHADLEAVHRAAMRIVHFGSAISQAHELGHGPGHLETLWDERFPEMAIEIFEASLPSRYLRALGLGFAQVAQVMRNTAPPCGLSDDWSIIRAYLFHTSEVLMDDRPMPEIIQPSDFEDATPAVMRFDRLAEVASISGVTRLTEAAGRVVRSLQSDGHRLSRVACPFDPDDLDILREIASGRPHVDIATDLGYSRRTLYRRIETMIGQLSSVSSTTGLVAVAIREDWI